MSNNRRRRWIAYYGFASFFLVRLPVVFSGSDWSLLFVLRCPNSKGFLRGIRRMRACSVANKIIFLRRTNSQTLFQPWRLKKLRQKSREELLRLGATKERVDRKMHYYTGDWHIIVLFRDRYRRECTYYYYWSQFWCTVRLSCEISKIQATVDVEISASIIISYSTRLVFLSRIFILLSHKTAIFLQVDPPFPLSDLLLCTDAVV